MESLPRTARKTDGLNMPLDKIRLLSPQNKSMNTLVPIKLK